jgi:hypothetical protein
LDLARPKSESKSASKSASKSEPWKVRLAAGVVTGALAIGTLAMTTAPSTDLAGRTILLTISLQIAATLARGVTGRVSASVLARLTGLAVCTFL